MAAVAWLLRCSPGLSATQYARDLDSFDRGLSVDFYERRQQVRRRLTDLKNKGLATRIGAAGEGEVRWYPSRVAMTDNR